MRYVLRAVTENFSMTDRIARFVSSTQPISAEAIPFAFAALKAAYHRHGWLRLVTALALIVLYVLAIARSVTVPFQPFIYFRF